jgi:hypothetical protein
MFAFFNLGLQELIILGMLGLVPLVVLLALYLSGAFGKNERRDD